MNTPLVIPVFHIFSYLAENTQVLIQSKATKPIKTLLKDCLHLMALSWIFKYAGDFQIYCQLTNEHLEYLKKHMNALLSKLRPIAVSIVDSFDIHDQSLFSTLGTYPTKFFIYLDNDLICLSKWADYF